MDYFNYSTIVFDLGNVLIPFDHGKWISNYNSIATGLGDKYYQKYLDDYSVHRDYESGKISDDKFVNQNLEWLENKVTSEEFKQIFSNIFTLNHDVIDLLPLLKKKYRLVLLSNTNNIHKVYGWQKYSFLDNFDKLILSHEVGSVKPEQKIYNSVIDFTQEDPSSHIFIDDVEEYANAAKLLGWDAIQFIGYNNLLEEFTKRNIIY